MEIAAKREVAMRSFARWGCKAGCCSRRRPATSATSKRRSRRRLTTSGHTPLSPPRATPPRPREWPEISSLSAQPVSHETASPVVFKADTRNEEPAMSTATTTTRHIVTETSIGPLTIVRDDEGLTGVYFPGHWTRPDRKTFGPPADADDTEGFDESFEGGFGEAIEQLNEYLACDRREFDLPLAPRG